MTIDEVYKKWKHLSKFLNNKKYMEQATFGGLVLYDLWQVIKKEIKKKEKK